MERNDKISDRALKKKNQYNENNPMVMNEKTHKNSNSPPSNM